MDLRVAIEPELKTLIRLFAQGGYSKKDAAPLWGLLNFYLEDPKEFERNLIAGLASMKDTDWVGIGSEFVDELATDFEIRKVFPLWYELSFAVESTAFTDEVLAAEVYTTLKKIVTVAVGERATEDSMSTIATARAFMAFASGLFVGHVLDRKAIIFIFAPVMTSLDSNQRLDMTMHMDAFFPGKF